MQGAQAFLTALDQDDYTAAHAMLASSTAQEVDEDDLQALAQHFSERYGDLKTVRLDFSGNALTYPLAGGERLLGYDTGGDFPPLPIKLEFESGTVEAAVKAEISGQKTGPGDPGVRLKWLALLEADLGLRTFPPGRLPQGVAVALNNNSWYTCRELGRTDAEYQRALIQAEQACALEPSGTYLNTLGVAQYRVGLYPEALKTLQKADELNGGIPEDVAFLAMLHHRLGDEAQAKKEMARLRQSLSNSRLRNDPEARAFLKEAEDLLDE